MKKETQLANQIKKLQYQLSYSEHINKEMAQQLAFLYDKAGIPPAKLKQSSDIDVLNSQIHLQELYYVEPMLMCYEQTIYLLKNEFDQLKQQGEQLNDQVKKVVKQNNFLRKQLQNKIEILKKSDNLGVNTNFLTLENKDLKEKLEVLNSKCEYMARKNKQLEEEVNKNRKDKLAMYGEHQLQKIQNKNKQEIKTIQTENIQLKNQIDILKNQLENQKSLVLQYERKKAQNQSNLTKLKNQLRVCKQHLDNQETVHNGAEEMLQIEVQNLKQLVKSSQKKEQGSFQKNMTLQSQLQDKNNRLHNLNIQISQLQTNNNNMLQMLESYEVKVTNLNKKIKKFQTQQKQLKEDGSQINKKADIAEWKLTEKVEEMERKESQWKKERNRITKMWEERLEALRKNYQNQSNS